MGNALRNLGKRNNNSTQLKEAVSAFHDALQERTPEQVPIDWAITQNNLGNVLVNLSEHESGTARLEQAIIAYSAALVEFRKSAATFYIGVASQNLSEAEAALATRRAEQQ
jgi:tetratricopeptide (TPR) repeat protein